jgi:hypothetical protein
MPSRLHDTLLHLFNNRPELAPELLREALQVDLPEYSEARIASADLTDIQPAEYRADLVLHLMADKPLLGIIVEVQLQSDERKKFVWPAYAMTLRARLECPVCVLVITNKNAVAKWAAAPISTGHGSNFTPLVLGPAGVPIVTDSGLASAHPELAILSAMAHGRSAHVARAVAVAHTAQAIARRLDAIRSKLYLDLIRTSLSDAARQEFRTMDLGKLYVPGSYPLEIAAERSRVAMLMRLLTKRFGTLPVQTEDQLSGAGVDELDDMAERLLTASSPKEVLGPYWWEP